MGDDIFSFEKLDVYDLALQMAKKVCRITSEVKKSFYWIDQINRATTSISLNIAEGSGRWNNREKRNFYNIARGSVYECVPLIELGLTSGILNDEQRDELRGDCVSIAKMLTKLIQSFDKEDQTPDRVT